MKTLIPTLCAILIMGTAQAQQEASYASISKPQTSSASAYASVPTGISETYIKIKGRTDRKLVLAWAPFPGGVSHYVLERSLDGHRFEEEGMFFTGDWNEQTEYFYTEKFRKPISGMLFYRLRVVGVDGSVVYTPVTILNTLPEAN